MTELAKIIEKVRNHPDLMVKSSVGAQIGPLLGQFSSLSVQVGPGQEAGAIGSEEGFWLMAEAGMPEPFVLAYPRAAGRAAVIRAVNKIAAVGGAPIAMSDSIACDDPLILTEVMTGISEAARAYGVSLLAGRTDISYSGARLSLTLTGRANRLTPCNKAKPGDEILVAVDLRGQGFGTPLRFWDCSQDRKAGDLWADIGILPFFSEEKFVRTSKSVGLSGIVGTIALLAEASGFGCQIDLDEMPCPPHVEMADWLCAFMSFGFVFTAHSRDVQKTIEVLGSRHIACESVGQIAIGGRVELELGDEVEVIFDLRDEPIRGWKP